MSNKNKNNNSIGQYTEDYLAGAVALLFKLSKEDINKIIERLIELKKRQGRLFLLGVGGGAANCSHAVNDFRKICHIESYAPTDNVGELTARTNDDGWDSVFVNWLKISQLSKKDAVMVFSVGGGNKEKNISANIVEALKYAKEKGAGVLGIVSRDGGYTKKVAGASGFFPLFSLF